MSDATNSAANANGTNGAAAPDAQLPRAAPNPQWSAERGPVPPPFADVADAESPTGRVAALSNYCAKFVDRVRVDIAAIEADGDLSDVGKTKKVVSTILGAIERYSKLLAEPVAEIAKERQRLDERIRKLMREAAIDPCDHAEIRSWLRSLPLEQKCRVLREAASGKMAGGTDVMTAVLSAFPSLSGFDDRDPTLKLCSETHVARRCPAETTRLEALAEAERLAGHAFGFVAGSLERHAPKGALAEHRRASTPFGMARTTAEKSKAVTDAIDAGKSVRDILSGN